MRRADSLLTILDGPGGGAGDGISEAYTGALGLLRLVYGSESLQEAQLVQAMSTADKKPYGRGAVLLDYVDPAVRGALRALKGDIEAGLVGRIGMQASGEVLGDLLNLARSVLSENANRKNVAAVLVAAAFEDALRRLAREKADVTDRIDLQDIIGVLKKANVLAGGAVSAASGYLRFRNDSLHADWDKVDLPTIQGCLAFVESLLLMHFS